MVMTIEPWLSLAFATLLILGSFASARLTSSKPVWVMLAIRLAAFGAVSWLAQRSIGLVTVSMTSLTPGMRVWAQLVEIGWWILGAGALVGSVRFAVVLEGRPRQTRIVADLLAGAIYTATVLAVVNYVFQVPIGGLIATSGIIAIVLGLALQSTLSDVFSGIAMGLEHAYKPGDMLWVEGNVEGQVVQICWRSTHIATLHNSIAVIPNSIIAKARFENRSAPTPTRSVTLPINIDASIDPRRCIAVFQAAIKACQIPLTAPQPAFNCVGLQGDGNLYQVRFTVATGRDIESARTEALALIHRHLHHAGIRLAVPLGDMHQSASIPTLSDLIAASDLLGPLAPDERGLFAEHFQLVRYDAGQVLIKQDELPDAVFLIASGTVDVTRDDVRGTHALLRSSPADTIGAVPMISGMPALFTATALTPVSAYRLDKDSIAAVMRVKPELSESLEAQALRGNAWIRCETEANMNVNTGRSDMLARLRRFLHRLNADA
jgi:small-conductance mechanosensitive channel/CRP-like cAMP-binding protein